MARKYAVEGQAAAGTNVTILTLVDATTTRGFLYDMLIGSDATPADIATEYNLLRFTAAGTAGSSPTGRALDPGNPAALITAGAGVFSAEPTYTANSAMLNIALNQRATFRWVASPGGEIVLPVTSANGIGLRSIASGATPNTNCTMHWEE
jgi:hypothetical protein